MCSESGTTDGPPWSKTELSQVAQIKRTYFAEENRIFGITFVGGSAGGRLDELPPHRRDLASRYRFAWLFLDDAINSVLSARLRPGYIWMADLVEKSFFLAV